MAAIKQAAGVGKAPQNLIDKVKLYIYLFFKIMKLQDDRKETETEKKLREELKEARQKLKKAESDRDAMKSQSENLQEKYDRVAHRIRELEVIY